MEKDRYMYVDVLKYVRTYLCLVDLHEFLLLYCQRGRGLCCCDMLLISFKGHFILVQMNEGNEGIEIEAKSFNFGSV